MVAKKKDLRQGAGLCEGDQRPRRLGEEIACAAGLEGWPMNSRGGGRLAGALLGEGRKPFLAAAILRHAAHHAMVLAVPAAAGREIRVGIRGKQRRHRQQAEQEQQRKCNRAAHSGRVDSKPTSSGLGNARKGGFPGRLGSGYRSFRSRWPCRWTSSKLRFCRTRRLEMLRAEMTGWPAV